MRDDGVRKGRERWLGRAELALAMATVGTTAPAAKVIGAALPPFLASALRLGLAAAVLVPWAVARHGRAVLRDLGAHDLAILALQAAAGSVGFTVLLLLGTARTGAAEASIVVGTLPVVATLVAVVILGERPGWRGALAAGIATAGVVILGAAPARGRDPLAGDLLVLGAVTSESLFILLQKRLHRTLPALGQSAAMVVLGLVFTTPAALGEVRALRFASVGAHAWLAVGWYALVPTVAGFVLWYRGAARVSAAEASVYTAIAPLSGAAAAALVLGERLGRAHVTALALVVAAVGLTAWPRREQQDRAPRLTAP